MKVVYLKAVEHARPGDVKEVADGYARNFLLPRGLARAATPEALRQLETQRAAEEKRQARQQAEAEAMVQRISGLSLRFEVKVGAQKRLHGSVTAQDVAYQLKKQHDIDVDKRDIALPEPIKRTGDFTIEVHIGHGLTATLPIVVAAEG